MIFSSWQFILAFLPAPVLIDFWLNGRRWVPAGKAWLVLAGLFFYAFWDIRYLPLILISIAMNYVIGSVFSPGIWWIGSRMKRSGSEVQTLQMYSWGVRPLRVLSLRAKLQAARKSARC